MPEPLEVKRELPVVADREHVDQWQSARGIDLTVCAVQDQIVTHRLLVQVNASQALLQAGHTTTDFERAAIQAGRTGPGMGAVRGC